jgi:hypothetical protein
MSSLSAPRVPLSRVFLICGGVLAAEVALLLVLGQRWQATLLPGYAIILLAFGAAFCLGAVTVAGFVAGAGCCCSVPSACCRCSAVPRCWR